MPTDEMAEKICREVLKRLNKAGIETKQLDFQELQDRKVGALSKPAVNISINSGTYKKITLTTYKTIAIVTVYLMVSELRGEAQRRFMVLNLIEAINNALFLQKLGLELQDPLIPVSFANVTDEKYASAGFQIYELKFTCSFNITFDREDDLGMLKSIVAEYYLQDPTDDGVSDLSQLITLVGIWGGSAFSTRYKPVPSFGGHANSKFGNNPYFGGNARSAY